MNARSTMCHADRAQASTVVPLGVVAVVWVAITVFFPTTEPEQPDFAADIGAEPPIDFDEGFAVGDGFEDQAEAEAEVDGDGAAQPEVTGAGPTPGEVETGETGGTSEADSDAVPAAGVARSGVECVPGARQIPLSNYAAPCVPEWSGDNGGATYRGVTEDTIRIVHRRFPSNANTQALAAVAEQAGGASAADVRAAENRLKAYYNEAFELYGRTVEWVDYESRFGSSTSEAQSKGREGACLDADVIANELNAFAVGNSVSGPFAECAAARGLMVLYGAAYFSEMFYRDHHPYVWATTPNCERVSHQVAEYIGKRLAHKPARWAGDPTLRSRTRSFGTYVPNNPEYQHCSDITEQAMAEDFGLESGSRYNYTLDVSRFPDEAARGVIQFNADDVTTVVLAADPISVIFLTQSATTHSYRPEWFLIGVALQDTDNLAQLYDQSQVVGHMFGMSQLGPTNKVAGPHGEGGRVHENGTGQRLVEGTDGGYAWLTHAYNLLQAAGPNLTPASIAQGAWSLPPAGAPDYVYGEWSFQDGPDGTPGGREHTAIQDSREVYWTDEFVSPVTGNAGTFVETYDGQRFSNGEWPEEDPQVYPGR